MTRVRLAGFLISLLFLSVTVVVPAQEPASSPSATEQTDEQKQKEKEAAEKKATELLEQVVGEVQLLKLPENRISVEIAAGQLLWKRNETRARSLFTLAADGVAEMNRSTDGNVLRRAAQLRQQLVLTAAEHDAPLAYQILATTRPSNPTDQANNFRRSPDFNLEETLLARVAATDPKLAAQKVEEELAKGQYPNTLAQVIARLQSQDKEAATKLTAKVVSKLQSENMLANVQAQSLALNLLRGGPITAATPASGTPGQNQNQTTLRMAAPVLGEAAFQGLMGTVIDAALKATPQTASSQASQNQRGQNRFRGRGNSTGGPNQSSLSDAQLEQQNARRLLGGLQMVLPQIEQYLPARAAAVRNKMTELGMNTEGRQNFNQLSGLMQQGTTESLLAAASNAPGPLQPRLYQQAAQKALEEGNTERARQIANEHLDGGSRERVLQSVEFQSVAKKAEANNLDELRQTLAALRTDDERIDLLLQMAAQAKWGVGENASVASPGNPKLALQFLSEAQTLTSRRATNYQQLEQQLRVADALATVDPARSFEVLDPGIAQLNELLAAATVLNGFEVSIFRDGELPLDGGSGLGSMVGRYGRVLATLAKTNFERAESSANKFHLAEPRLLAKLAIVRTVLDVREVTLNNGFGGGRERRRQR